MPHFILQVGRTHTDRYLFPLRTFFLSTRHKWGFLPELGLWLRADLGREAQERRIQPWCPGSASLRSSWAAKPFLLRGPADPSSSSRVSAYKPETPRLQINLRLQLEGQSSGAQATRGWAGRREEVWEGGGRRRGSSSQSGREALIHAPLGSPSLEQTGREPKEGPDLQTHRRSKIRLLRPEIQRCSLGLIQAVSQSPSPQQSNRARVIQCLRLLNFTREINIPVTSARCTTEKCTYCFVRWINSGSVFTSVLWLVFLFFFFTGRSTKECQLISWERDESWPENRWLQTDTRRKKKGETVPDTHTKKKKGRIAFEIFARNEQDDSSQLDDPKWQYIHEETSSANSFMLPFID